MLQIGNGRLAVVMAPERGAEIRSLTLDGGPNALAHYNWTTPAVATAAHYYGDSETDWLAGYRGGWQETIPNAGSACTVSGVPLSFHGEASILGWTVQESEDDACVLSVGLRLPLTVTRTMTVDRNRPVLRVQTSVRNESPRPVPFVWGHHPAFPAVEGTRVELPARRFTTEPAEAGDIATGGGAWPKAADHEGRAVDLRRAPDRPTMRCFYLHGHSEGWAVVHQPAGRPSVAMSWDLNAYPATWLWQMRDDPGYPWFGRMRVLAVEPQAAWPYDGLSGAIDRGQAKVVQPNETLSSWLTMALLDEAPELQVSSVDRDGTMSTRP